MALRTVRRILAGIIGLHVRSISTDKAGDAFGVDFLSSNTETCLLASGRSFLLLSDHDMDFFGLDILADMPCSQAVFVLFFSGKFECQGKPITKLICPGVGKGREIEEKSNINNNDALSSSSAFGGKRKGTEHFCRGTSNASP